MTTDERIATLEKHLDTLRATQADLRDQLRQARVDHWQDRIDDLELQIHLGAGEGSERVAELTQQLRSTWEKTCAQMQEVSDDASSAAETLRSGLSSAYDDVRKFLLDIKDTIAR